MSRHANQPGGKTKHCFMLKLPTVSVLMALHAVVCNNNFFCQSYRDFLNGLALNYRVLFIMGRLSVSLHGFCQTIFF